MGWLNRAMVALRLSKERKEPGTIRVYQPLKTVAGPVITPDTALQISTVWACLRYLSTTVAALPWRVMREGPRGGEKAPSHPVDWLLWKRPSTEWSSFQFRETLMHWALRWGNGYAEIERDQLGRPFALWPIHPERVKVCRNVGTGQLEYEVQNDLGAGKVTIAAADIFHLRGFGEGVVGLNVIDYAAESLGWARAAQLFGAAFFGNGASLSGIITMQNGLSIEAKDKLKAELDTLYRGVRNSNKVAILDNDMKYSALGVEPEKGQFIETNQHLVEEICRWFGVPPHKAGHLLRSTFNNIEHQAIEVVVDAITPWVKRFEDEADAKLFGQNRGRLYSKINLNALMRGDVKSRAEYYRMMLQVGAFSPNRILELEDENTIGPDGDKHVMQQAMTTLDKIGADPVAAPAPPRAPADDDPPADEDGAEIAAMREFIDWAAEPEMADV